MWVNVVPQSSSCGCNWRLIARWNEAIDGVVRRGRDGGSSAAFRAAEVIRMGWSVGLVHGE
jgi:hypothetical protein